MNAQQIRAEMLTHVLALAIMAPTDKHAERAAAMAEGIAQGMSPAEVEACKAAALQLLESPHHDTHRTRLH